MEFLHHVPEGANGRLTEAMGSGHVNLLPLSLKAVGTRHIGHGRPGMAKTTTIGSFIVWPMAERPGRIERTLE
jgi:hypothetical protein